MPKRMNPVAFTVAVGVKDGDGVQIYAVLAVTARDAVEAVRAVVGGDPDIELCGHLSGKIASRLQLKPGEIRPI
jgi:hypothetical protein